MIQSIVAISAGASLGALLRWVLGLKLNSVFPLVPLGTVAANLGGGYLIGLAAAFLASRPELPPEWRLLLITGFLGGLTTFSTFSAEVVSLLQRGEHVWAAATVLLHVTGSILMTILGYATFSALRGA